jgi:hypothetical protein
MKKIPFLFTANPGSYDLHISVDRKEKSRQDHEIGIKNSFFNTPFLLDKV